MSDAPTVNLLSTGDRDKKMRATKKGIFCVTLDSKILMYDSTLRFSHLRKP